MCDSNLPNDGPQLLAPQVVAEDGSIVLNQLQVFGPSDMVPGSGPLSIFKSKPQPSPEEEGLAQVPNSSLSPLLCLPRTAVTGNDCRLSSSQRAVLFWGQNAFRQSSTGKAASQIARAQCK